MAMSRTPRATARTARFLGQTESYDAIILDLGLPVLDGLSVLQGWRQEGLKTPVLVLTARDTWSDKVKGLRAGADDYLAKPFHMEELIARVEALIRRDKGSVRSLLTCGEVQLDAATGRVTRRGEAVVLTALEHRLLAYLMHRPGRDRLQGGADRAHLRPGLRQGFERHRGAGEPAAQEVRRRLHQDPARPRLHDRRRCSRTLRRRP